MDRNDKKKAKGRMTVTAKKNAGQSESSLSPDSLPGARPEEGMSPTLQAHIGRQVRAMFDEVAQEPIPDHLLRLLKELDKEDGDR